MNLGTTSHTDRRRKRTTHNFFKLDVSQRLRHLYVLGKSGTGKSTALTNWALQDIKQGLGCFFIDPHGDDAELLLERIPVNRRKNVIYFNPSEFPVSFNLLDGVPKEQWSLVASSILDTIKTIWHLEDAPNVDMFVLASIAALLETPGSTLMSLQFMLDTPAFRESVIEKITDPIIKRFWEHTFQEHMTDREQRDRTLSTLNKIFTLISDPAIRYCIEQAASAFNFADIMEYNLIFIASLPQGKLGIEKAAIIGSFLFSHFHISALARPPKFRHLFTVYANEAHHFINKTTVEGLTGFRKFGVAMCLSHQSMSQIKDARLRAMVLGSIDTLVAFKVGPTDAKELAEQFEHIKPDDLMTLPPHRALVRTGNQTIELTMPPLTGKRWTSAPRVIRRNSRTRYSRPIEAIEAEIRGFVEGLEPEQPRPPRESHPFKWHG
jgi:hypothetical protein